jgi:PAS domain S-box-containing protein
MRTQERRLVDGTTDANELLRTVIDENPNIILMKDWDGKFLIGNRALADLYGTTPENLVGKDDGDFNPNAEQVAFFLQNVREIMSQSETKVVMEESTNATTGEVSYYQSIKKPLVTKDGKKQILVIANDVSELKRVQQQLEESERRLRYALDATQEGIWDWNITTGLVTHNSRWCQIVGLDDNHLQHQLERFAELLHPDDREAVMQRLQLCLDGKARYQSEHRMVLKDGSEVWVLDRGDVVERAADGRPLRMVGSFMNINERKASELSLGVRTELLNAIFDLSPDGFISFDEARCVSYVSPAFSAMSGMPQAELQGLSEQVFSDLLGQRCVSNARFKGVARLRDNALQGVSDEREMIELSLSTKRTLEVGLRLSKSTTVSQILYFRDITHETEVDQMKSEFLSTAAHELRTPMASIYGFAEVLLTQKLNKQSRQEFLEIIFRQSELMTSILNELLDLARIEARRGKDFVKRPHSVVELVSAVAKDFRLPKGRTAPVLHEPTAPAHILVDYKKARQAILNVLSNAYKYSAEGTPVEITIEALPDSSMVGIRTVDQGIGMSSEQLRRVTERFYRADTSGAVSGTGLGMSIVKEIVELHHGSLEVCSEPGKGTVVTLLFPMADQEGEHG